MENHQHPIISPQQISQLSESPPDQLNEILRQMAKEVGDKLGRKLTADDVGKHPSLSEAGRVMISKTIGLTIDAITSEAEDGDPDWFIDQLDRLLAALRSAYVTATDRLPKYEVQDGFPGAPVRVRYAWERTANEGDYSMSCGACGDYFEDCECGGYDEDTEEGVEHTHGTDCDITVMLGEGIVTTPDAIWITGPDGRKYKPEAWESE